MLAKNNKTSGQYPYDACHRLLETERNLYYILQNGQGLILDKANLKGGSVDELRAWMEKGGLPLKKLWNTSGMGYRALNLKERLPGMSEDEQLRLLATDGMLVKRPILVGDDFVLTGFKEAEWSTRLG